MNAMIKAIRSRRSVRSYEGRSIPHDLINSVIEAGNEAPSAMNSQPWRFVVVEDTETKRKLLGAALPHAKKILEMVKEGNPERYKTLKKRYEELDDPVYYSAPAIVFVIGFGQYANYSCPLACQNMMLAAHSFGLGSCWVGFGAMVTDDPEVRTILDLKEDEKIFGPILLGYPKGYPEGPPKKEPRIKWI
ncbi:MAG TPA: nitroreductase [Nitrospiraceae bacterium]|jgi:nitroreductase|nr:nitroreductase [Nitrospiraceae bacterium]